MRRQRTRNVYLRTYAVAMVAIVFLAFLVMVTFVTQRLHVNNRTIVDQGQAVLTADTLKAPVYLNGEWETFEKIQGEYQKSDTTGKLVDMPLADINQAESDAAYRVRLSLPAGTTDLALAIPTYSGSLEVYLNGEKQQLLAQPEEWIPFHTLKVLVQFNSIDSNAQWQELVITGDFSQEDITLYKRPVVISTISNLSTLVVFDSASEMFLIGIFMLLLVNGYVFMVFRPSHTLISMITIFDTLLLGRIFFSMNSANALIDTIFPGIQFSDRFCISIQLFFLMLAGIMGCILSKRLFDPNGKAPGWIIKPCPYIYGVFAVVFPLNIEFFATYGTIILYAAYVLTFVGVALQYYERWKTRKKPVYYAFQFVKTMYIGAIIFLDILCWNTYIDYAYLFYLYAIFFVMHVIVRLYDNDQSYRDTEVLNQNLEKIVAERTEELQNANQVLSEMSVRDPLTNAFNRLYFERAMEQAVAKCQSGQSTLHLCMLDLDFFKTVNDTYGHDAGDIMLKWVVSTVQQLVQEDATLARVGGEEFVLLYLDKTDTQVLQSIQIVHEAFEENAQHNPRYTTASFGVAKWSVGDSQKTVMKKADRALYRAKESGRNCIVSYGESNQDERFQSM